MQTLKTASPYLLSLVKWFPKHRLMDLGKLNSHWMLSFSYIQNSFMGITTFLLGWYPPVITKDLKVRELSALWLLGLMWLIWWAWTLSYSWCHEESSWNSERMTSTSREDCSSIKGKQSQQSLVRNFVSVG